MLNMPTKDIPTDTTNLSPALASVFAQISMPQQYHKFAFDAVQVVNSMCPSKVQHIDK